MLLPIKSSFCLLVGVLSVALGASSPARAEGAAPTRVELQASQDQRTVLTVAGPAGTRSFSLAELETIGLHRVTTSTFWAGEEGSFEGPLLADVLGHAGLKDAPAIKISALDGFSQLMPREDWLRWPIVLATRHRGEPMSVRNKGPLRIVYPRDMDPLLQESTFRLRWVWLVTRIEAGGQ